MCFDSGGGLQQSDEIGEKYQDSSPHVSLGSCGTTPGPRAVQQVSRFILEWIASRFYLLPIHWYCPLARSRSVELCFRGVQQRVVAFGVIGEVADS